MTRAGRLPGGAAAGRPRRAGLDAGADGARALDVRAGQARPRRHRLRGRPARHGRRCSPSTRQSPTRSAASTATSSSTSTRTSARCSRRCSTSGSASARRSASSATPTRPSTRSPAPRPTTCSASAQRLPAAHRGAAGARLPLHAAGRRPGQQDHHREATGPGAVAGSSWSAQRPAGPSPSCERCPTSRPRPGASRPACSDLVDGRHPGQRDRGAVPHQRPERDLRAGAGRRRRALRAARRRAVLRPARGARGRLLLRGAARSIDVRRRRRRAVRAVLSGGGWRDPSRPAAAARCASAGSRWPRWPAGRRPRRRPSPHAALARLRRRARPAGRRPARRRPSRASRSPRCTRPRGSSGTPSSSSAATRACCRSATPRRPRQVEEERRLLYVGVTRAREQLSIISGRWPGRPVAGRAAAVAVPRRHAARRRPAAGAGRAAARGRKGQRRATHCRVCGKAAHRTGRPQARALRRLPVALRRGRSSSGCASGARSRRGRASVPPYVVFTDATLTALAETRPTTERRCSHLRHRPDQAGALRRGCSQGLR